MKTKNALHTFVKLLLVGYCSAVMFVACSSDEENIDEAIGADAEAGEEAAAEGAETAAAEEESNISDEDTTDETIASNTEAEVTDNAVEEIPMDTAADSPVSEPEADPSVTELSGTTESAEYESANASESTPVAVPIEEDLSGPSEPAAGRVVRYVRADAVNLRQAATPNATTVGQLSRGDIVLVTYNGKWAQLDNGSFVAASSLSAKGVGRKRSGNSWRSSK